MRLSGKKGATDNAEEGSNGSPKGVVATPESVPSQLPRQKRRKSSDDAVGGAQDSSAQAAEIGGSQKRQRRNSGGQGAAEEGAHGWSDSEEEAMSALKSVVASETALAAGAADTVVDWRRGLEELRKKRAAQAEAAAAAAPALPVDESGEQLKGMFQKRPEPDQIVQLLRDAMKNREWNSVMRSFPPRKYDLAEAVRRLEPHEAIYVLKACARRAEVEPKERITCYVWIQQILEHCGESVLANKVLRRNLRPLLANLEQRLGSSSAGGETLACLGKWRYVTELAAERRSALKASGREGGSAASEEKEESSLKATAVEASEPVSEEESEDQDEDDAEEGDADDNAEGSEGEE